MDPTRDFESLQDGVRKSLVSTVKTVNRIAAEDLDFQRAVNPDVAQQLDDKAARLLDLSARLLRSAAKACSVTAPRLDDTEDLEMNWRGVVDVVDYVLEKADTALDEYTGLVKRKEPPTPDDGPRSKRPKSTAKVIRNANISKPQAKFEKKPDNFPTSPWKPLITTKPHALVPLEQSVVTFVNSDASTQYKHPYEKEITDLRYPKHVYKHDEPIMYQDPDSTEPIWVDTYEGVVEMLGELKKAKEIAVDLEHHDFRTYTGLVSLMQVSTRDKDWIVDTLQPWRHKLEILNEVFADPSIIKVFHGAYMDIIWLQRDLGLYVNGLFDTFFACKLMYPSKSLAFLLSKFVNFDADKQYQLADWRLRPLPEEMMYYARSDTHYLLYIYDRVRNDLLDAGGEDFLDRALEDSRQLSLTRHEHPTYDENTGEGTRGWYGYVLKHPHLSYNSEQFAVFRALWKWRDDTARKEDESTHFVLNTNLIADLARQNPPDAKALHSMMPPIAALARSRITEIWGRIQKAKAAGGPTLMQFYTSMTPESLERHGLPKPAKPAAPLPPPKAAEMTLLPRSRLFRDMPISTRWEEGTTLRETAPGNFPFPWQRFVEGGVVELEDKSGETAPVEAVPEAPPAAAEEADDMDEEFTLRAGRKRKSSAMADDSDETSSSGSDSGSDPSPDDNGVIDITPEKPLHSRKVKKHAKAYRKATEGMTKAEKKQYKVDEKVALKARKDTERETHAESAKTETDSKMYDAVPFDYTTAASVMHAGRRQAADAPQGMDGGRKKRKSQKKVFEAPSKESFDPYANSGGAEGGLKGARKAPAPRGERSGTFRR